MFIIKSWGTFFTLLVLLTLTGCVQIATHTVSPDSATQTIPTVSPTETKTLYPIDKAHIISVSALGEPGAYQFSVGISSPDKGCDQYADWWEVIDTNGELIYRRILLHSHVEEQPFIRSGGPIEIEEDQVVWIRAHMQPGGYGGIVYRGSIQNGFKAAEFEPGFARDLETLPPLPESRAF